MNIIFSNRDLPQVGVKQISWVQARVPEANVRAAQRERGHGYRSPSCIYTAMPVACQLHARVAITHIASIIKLRTRDSAQQKLDGNIREDERISSKSSVVWKYLDEPNED